MGHAIRASYEVPNTSMSNIAKHLFRNMPLVMSLDVEGHETNVLESNDWAVFRPDFILIKDLAPPWSNATDVNEFLENFAY